MAGKIINQAVWGILTQDYAAQLKRINYLSFGKKERELTRKMASKKGVASQQCTKQAKDILDTVKSERIF